MRIRSGNVDGADSVSADHVEQPSQPNQPNQPNATHATREQSPVLARLRSRAGSSASAPRRQLHDPAPNKRSLKAPVEAEPPPAKRLHRVSDLAGTSAVVRSPALDTHSEPDLKAATEIQELIALVREVKNTNVSPTTLGKARNKPKLVSLLNVDGTLKEPTANRRALALHNKLSKLDGTHPELVKALRDEAARPIARGAESVRQAQSARDIETLIPQILMRKDGAALSDILRRHGTISMIAHAFDIYGNPKPRSSPDAVALYRKLDAIEADYPDLIRRFEAAIARPSVRGDERAQLANEAVELEAYLPLIDLMRDGEAPTAVGDRFGVPSLRRIFNQGGSLKAREDSDSARAFHNRLDKIRDAYPELVRALEQGQRVQPRRSTSMRIDRLSALPIPSWNTYGKRGERLPKVFSARTDETNPALRAIKREPVDVGHRAPGAAAPIYVETELDQARTAFYRELGASCDLTGERAQWSVRLDQGDAVVVRHRMTPIADNERKFPLRDPRDPLGRAHARYAAPDGSCHPNVKLSKMQLSTGFRSYFRELAKSDPRLQVDRARLGHIVDHLEADAARELRRLIDEKPGTPRYRPRMLDARDVLAHESALIGQYGLFVRRPQRPEQAPTLSNGYILGFYMGALVEEDVDFATTEAAHPDYAHYAIDAHRHRGGLVVYSGLGATNGIAFANTAIKSDVAEPAYDRRRLNALFIEFQASLSDKDGRPRRENLVALVALDNLFENDGPEAQVLVDYGDAFLANFKESDAPPRVKPEPV